MVSEVIRIIKAPIEKVWAAAGDFTKSPDPSLPIEIEQKGDEANGGVGCLRQIKMGGRIFRERLESIDPPHAYTYSMLSGAPIKTYSGKVELTAEGANTRIRWSVNFTPRYPGTGWIINRINIKNYNKFIDELEKQL
jgi:carbon monoxide dehydrogenase subunit G